MASVPWQIWVVIALLAMEGLGNLLSIPNQPAALFWLFAKVLFVTGLIQRWKWVYGLFIVVGGLHVVYFLPIAPLASVINLLLIGLALLVRDHYFPQPSVTFGTHS